MTKKTPGRFRTRVIKDGVHPSLHISYKNFDLKQYFKEGRGCRTEGTFRNPNDFGINKGLFNLPYWQKIGWQINPRLTKMVLRFSAPQDTEQQDKSERAGRFRDRR